MIINFTFIKGNKRNQVPISFTSQQCQHTALTLIISFLPRNPGAGTGSDIN
jgi:hypothetical protein